MVDRPPDQQRPLVLVGRFWTLLHKLWGDARIGEYDKRSWSEFRDVAEMILLVFGAERRLMPRRQHDALELLDAPTETIG